ncbi:MAG: tRNA preQ1(34) S-adenosylmethionine ribosyltransferase-isomerase QueA [Candidatus Firestonebacteria bacterium]
MKLSDFDYNLPEELIALEPIQKRDNAKLMVLDRCSQKIEHSNFFEIGKYFRKGDVLILNNTKVVPARFFGENEKKAKIEILLLKKKSEAPIIFEALLKPGKKIKIGNKIQFGNNAIYGTVIARSETGTWDIQFASSSEFAEISKFGEMPLPPYIMKHRKVLQDDKINYQTTYAKHNGAIAAPTAGLHWTPELLDKVKKIGVKVLEITLHIGYGTFKPIIVEDIENHKMHEEQYEITEEIAYEINSAKKSGRRVIANGTSAVRTLESSVQQGKLEYKKDWSNLFIYPGYKFKVVDAMITNFHIPKSTVLILTCAFAGKDFLLNAYQEAIKNHYRFLSFGDATFVV